MLRKYILFILLIFGYSSLFCQHLPSDNDLRIDGKIFGKIIESATKHPVESATVQLSGFKVNVENGKKEEIVLALVVSNTKGEFLIDHIQEIGKYKILVTEHGFYLFEKQVELSKKNQLYDFGTIELDVSERTLDTVAVNSEKSLLQLSLDKKIYNVEKDLMAVGGTAIDVMKNIPGVQVDIDGNVFLRNADPQILVNGRPTTLALSQIPANQISTIEIITNPSAKYSAGSGGAGIINVVLKTNRRKGYNGNLRAGIDSRGKSYGGGDFNFLQSKINLFASLNVNAYRSITNTKTQRTDFLSNATVNTRQNNLPIVDAQYTYSRAGLDYFIDNKNTLSIATSYFKAAFDAKDLIYIDRDSVYQSSTSSSKSQRDVAVDASFKNRGGSAGYKHLFKREGQELTADINYNLSEFNNRSDYFSRYYDGAGNIKPYNDAVRPTGGSTTHGYIFQSDYTNPVSNGKKIETGVRFDLRNYTSWNDNYIKNSMTGTYELLPEISVKYNFEERVIAGYGTYTQQIKNFNFQVGLRVESSEYAGRLLKTNQKFKNNYPFSVFPSASVSQKLNDKEDIQVNFTRKVYRPGFFQLVPFVDFSDSLNIFIGNPSLKPEFTSLSEISYSNQFTPKHSILASAYLNYTDKIITRYQYKAPNTNPYRADSIVYNSYTNANKNYVTGLELTSKNQLAKWWSVTSNLNVYNVNLRADNIPGTKNNQLTSWFAKINSNIKFLQSYNFQLNADYQSKTILPPSSRSINGLLGNTQFNAQGEIKPTYGVDISIRKTFLKNNTASLTLQWIDIFRTRSYQLTSKSTFYSQEVYRLRDPQILKLNFTWQFGKLDASIFRRRSTKTERETLNSIQGGLGQ